MWSRSVEMLNPYAALLASAKEYKNPDIKEETVWNKIFQFFKRGK